MTTIETAAQALGAAKRYLEARGYASVRPAKGDAAGYLTATDPDDGSIVFVRATLAKDASNGLPADDLSREARAEAEAVAVASLGPLGTEPGAKVRFDLVCMAAVAGDRVLVRHHVDAFGSC